MNNRVFRTLGLFTVLTAFCGIPIAWPQGLGMDVTPTKFEMAIPLGTQQYNIPITVRNSSSDAIHVVASMVDFGLKQNGDYTFSAPGTRQYSLMKWASINPREFDVPANTAQQVRFTISVPASSDLSGEYSGIVFFQTRPARRAQAVMVSVRVATKIYATIPHTVNIDGAISKMTAANAPGGEQYRILFKNMGNAHLYLNGTVQIRKGDNIVQSIPMQREMLVERGGERLIQVDGNELPAGKYQVVAIIDYGGKTETGGQIVFDKQ